MRLMVNFSKKNLQIRKKLLSLQHKQLKYKGYEKVIYV